MENLGTNFVNNFDLTKRKHEITVIVARVRPGKSEIVKNILRIMRMDVPCITISPEDDIKLTNTEDNFKSANIEDECMKIKKCIIQVVIDIIFVMNVLLN